MDDLDLKKINAMLGLPAAHMNNDDSEDEDQLEAELNAILSGKSVGRASARNKKSVEEQMQSLNLDQVLNQDNDEPSDDDLIDENDPQLLAELNQYVQPSPLKVRPTPKPELPPSRVSSALTGTASCVQLQDSHFRSNDSCLLDRPNVQSSAVPLIPNPVKAEVPVSSAFDQTEQVTSSPTVSQRDLLNSWRAAYRNQALDAKKENNVQLALECLRETKVTFKDIRLALG
jgi:hypothetical protein